MRIIPTRIHGVLDYLVGVLLIASPWLFQFNFDRAETWLPVALGAAAVLYSLCTDYELGVLRLIPVPAHLTLDLLSGVLLALSPWLFGFHHQVWFPHLLIGVLEVGAALTTELEAEDTYWSERRYGSDLGGAGRPRPSGAHRW